MSAGGFDPRMLLSMLSARSAGGAGMGATGTGTAGPAVGNASTQLQGADPSMALKQIQQVKQTIVNMISPLAFRVPAASRALAGTIRSLDAALKELQQAASTAEAVGGSVGLSAIPRPQPPGAVGASPLQSSPLSV